jgi:uncharacterized protein (TIGR03437 family)
MITRIGKLVCFAAALLGVSASAQTTGTWDTSGNGLLNGQYYIRQVLWQIGDNSGDLGDAASVYGVITFSGTGTYTFSGQSMDAANSSTATPFSTSGSYSISKSGYGFMDNLLIGSTETIYGLVSQGIFIGSSTENLSGDGVNDLAIAAPIGATQATNATFKGTYSLIDFDSPTGSIYDVRDSLFTLTADGNGNLTGTTTGSGYIATNGGGVTRQTFSGTKYAFSNGGGNIFFSGSLTTSNTDTLLLAGNHYVYISPDGNFIFGGSPNGWDMFIGVRTGTGAPTAFGGLYYQAGMDADNSNLGAGFANLDSYFGSFKAQSNTILEHQRVLSVFNNNPFDYTFSDTYTFNADGTSDDTIVTSQHYIYGLNGAIRIGIGNYPFLGLNVALAAPTFSGSGVFLDPTGVVNSASFAQFTSSVVPGEFLTLFGSGLSPKNDTSSSFPTKLDGVQVLMNGVAVPIYYVQSGAISVLVPYGITGPIADIQVVNNNVTSNTVSVFIGATQPGIFSFVDSNGTLTGIAQRFNDNYSLVTSANPAQPNDTLIVYATGLGAVTPTIPDGSIANGTYTAANTINAYIGGIQATVGFAGLVPGNIGLYQINLTVPTGITPGNNILELTGPDADNFQTIIPVGSGSAGVNAVPQARTAGASVVARPHIGKVSKGLPGKIEPLKGRPIQHF